MKYKNALLFVTVFILCLYFAASYEDVKVKNQNCECIDYDCGCCGQLYIKSVLDGKLCSNFSYLPNEYGISVTITYNDFPIINETVSVKNPPEICIIHVDELKMEICLRLYNLDIKNKCLSGCAEFDVHFFKLIPLKHIKLGCFGCKKDLVLKEDQNKDFEFFQYVVDTLRGKQQEPKVVLI